MRFEFATTGRIVFGEGTRTEIAALAASMGSKAFVVVTNRIESVQEILETLAAAGIRVEIFDVQGEPSIESVANGAQAARTASCDLVIAVGGGSVIDTGKAVAALVANGGEPLDYLEVIGRGQALSRPSLPMIAVPTTSGTGAEVTRNAVLFAPEQRVKVSLRSVFMLPDVAILDPELTYSVPPNVTASTGLDAFTQCLEPYVSNQANPLTDSVARSGIQLAARSLHKAYLHGQDSDARRDMALASLFGGLALANAKLGAVHGFAGVLGGMYSIPHGIVCARLLPFVMESNVRALEQRAPDSPVLERYGQVAGLVTGRPSASIEDGNLWIQELCEELGVPALGAFGAKVEDFPAIIAMSQNASSMKGNPIELTAEELEDILLLAL